MARLLRHRQTKGAETDTPGLTFTAPHSYSTVKTIARGMPGVSGVTVVTNARVYYTTRGCGRIGRPAFPAPSDWGVRKFLANLGHIRPRDREAVAAKYAAV